MDAPDVSFLEALIMAESSGDPMAFNKGSGARGLTQITPIAFKDLQNWFPDRYKGLNPEVDLFKPDVSRQAGADYLSIVKKYLKNYGMPVTTENILGAYNYGIGNIRKTPMEKWPKETLDYIEKITKFLEKKKK